MPRAQTGLKNSAKHLAGIAAAALLALAPHAASAGNFKVLHSFCGDSCKGGFTPIAGLVSDASGNLYGATTIGGENNGGTIFELKRQENGKYRFRVLYDFASASEPYSTLIVDVSGNLYGTTYNSSQAFELSPGFGKNGKRWELKTLYQFCSQQNCVDGSHPLAGLTYKGAESGVPYDGASPLYGTTQQGGANGLGTVFQLSLQAGRWTETVLYSLCSQGGDKCTDGSRPEGGVLLDQAGNLFGTAAQGANEFQPFGAGVVFELSWNGQLWVQTTLYRFCAVANCADGAEPIGSLVMDSSGTLFGVTRNGGRCKIINTGCGALFSLVPNGADSQERVVHAFCTQRDCKDGRLPQAGPLFGPSGNLFGTTTWGGGHNIDLDGSGGGVLYQIAGTSYKLLHRFCSLADCADGAYPEGSLILGSSGDLAGTTADGGSSGAGTVFQYAVDQTTARSGR